MGSLSPADEKRVDANAHKEPVSPVTPDPTQLQHAPTLQGNAPATRPRPDGPHRKDPQQRELLHLKQSSVDGKWYWVSAKGDEWVPDRNQGTAESRVPPASPEQAQASQGNTKAVAEIARKLDLPEGSDLTASRHPPQHRG